MSYFTPDIKDNPINKINPSLVNKSLQNLSKVVCTRLRKTNELLMENQTKMKKTRE